VQSFLSFGRFHIPVFGLFAAVGLMCAMALSQRTARWARVDRDALWDAGMVTVFATFVLSRLLLVVEDLRTFLLYPVLVLELPSLTSGGLLLTAIVAVVYLRRRSLPVLNVLDAAAPCTALLWAFLSLGKMAEGTRDGIPATVPWAIPSSFGRVHPVELYSALAWLVLCAVLLWMLRRTRMLGETAAWGLLLGGLVLFFADFFRLPGMLYGNSWLDGDEWRGLQLMVAGSLLLAWRLAVGARMALGAKGVDDAV
jgi:phosphatidylglycerol---prolipoprotein diacylglyceryl transferase